MALMVAQYGGVCWVCQRKIRAGHRIDWDRERRRARHDGCEVPAEVAAAAAAEAGAKQTAAHRVAFTGKHRGEGPGVGVSFRDWESGAVLTVVAREEEYVDEDGMSFGLMADSGWSILCYCREASEAEAAPIVAAEERAAAASQRAARRREIARDIQERGERPWATPSGSLAEAEAALPEGERWRARVEVERLPVNGYVVLNQRTIYGGGDCFVVGAEHIWYVRANGADGDDWAASNTALGIAWRVPFDQALADELMALDAAEADARVRS